MRVTRFINTKQGVVQVTSYIVRDGLGVLRLVTEDGNIYDVWCIEHLTRRCLLTDLCFHKRAHAFTFVRSLPDAPWSAPDIESIPESVRAEVNALADAFLRNGAALTLEAVQRRIACGALRRYHKARHREMSLPNSGRRSARAT